MKIVRLKGYIILDILARKSLSQNWLAAKLGVSSGYMSQLLSGKRSPSPKVRRRILEYLPDKEFEELFDIS